MWGGGVSILWSKMSSEFIVIMMALVYPNIVHVLLLFSPLYFYVLLHLGHNSLVWLLSTLHPCIQKPFILLYNFHELKNRLFTRCFCWYIPDCWCFCMMVCSIYPTKLWWNVCGGIGMYWLFIAMFWFCDKNKFLCQQYPPCTRSYQRITHCTDVITIMGGNGCWKWCCMFLW